MVTKIQRWSPDTCGCVIEQFVDYDDDGNAITEPQFLLLNDICDKHRTLASRVHSEDHVLKASRVMSILEETKARNLKQVDDMMAKVTRKTIKRDLAQCREQVLAHNQKITEEWEELTSFTHAFDSHIHDNVMKEQHVKNLTGN